MQATSSKQIMLQPAPIPWHVQCATHVVLHGDNAIFFNVSRELIMLKTHLDQSVQDWHKAPAKNTRVVTQGDEKAKASRIMLSSRRGVGFAAEQVVRQHPMVQVPV